MEKQTQNTTSWFKRLPILWKILGVSVILAGLVFASGEVSFDSLTKIFGSKAGTANYTVKQTWDVVGIGVGVHIYSIVSTETTTYIGGRFSGINGIERKSLAAIDNATGEMTDWNPNLIWFATWPGRVTEMVIKDRTIYVTGTFSIVDGVERAGIVAINLDATQSGEYVTDWNPPVHISGHGLAIKEDILYLSYRWSSINWTASMGGEKERYGYVAFNLLANSDDDYFTDWAPNIYDFENDERFESFDVFWGGGGKLLIDDDRIYVFGGGLTAEINDNDGKWTTARRFNDYLFALTTEVPESGEYRIDWDPNVANEISESRLDPHELSEAGNDIDPYDGRVKSAIVKDNIMYIGGSFNFVDGQPRRGLAAIRTDVSTNGEYVTNWNPDIDHQLVYLDRYGDPREDKAEIGVRSMVLSGDELYIAGGWESIDGKETPTHYNSNPPIDNTPLRYFASVTTDITTRGNYLRDWRPDPSLDLASMYSLNIVGNVLYIGGSRHGKTFALMSYELDIANYDEDPDPVVALERVVLSPSTSSLELGGEQLFTATAYDSDGEVMSGITYIWAVAGGTTNTNTGTSIVYTAGDTAGSFAIEVSATDGTDTVADTSQVTIVVTVVEQAQLERVELSPSTSTLQPSNEQTFTAIAYDSNGEAMEGITYTWEVAGGIYIANSDTIIYTAGNTEGDFTILVSATNGIGTVADTSTVRIVIPIPQPTPPPIPQPIPEQPLPESGPEDVWMLLVLASLIGAGLVYKRQFQLVSEVDIYQNENNGDE